MITFRSCIHRRVFLADSKLSLVCCAFRINLLWLSIKTQCYFHPPEVISGRQDFFSQHILSSRLDELADRLEISGQEIQKEKKNSSLPNHHHQKAHVIITYLRLEMSCLISNKSSSLTPSWRDCFFVWWM